MSAPRSKGLLFYLSHEKTIPACAFFLYPLVWGLLQGASKPTAGKDRLFFILSWLYKTSHHHKYALLYLEDRLVSLLDC